MKAIIPILATLLAASFGQAAEPAAQTPAKAAAAAADARPDARRKDLAEALVTISRFDELMFSACADQAIGIGAGRPGHRDAAAQAAFEKLKPELRQLGTEAFADAFDESTLRAAIAFYATEEGQRYALDWTKLNSTVNLAANKRWMDWTKRIRETPAAAAPVADPGHRDGGF